MSFTARRREQLDMKMILILSILSQLNINPAWGWGNQGHSKINSAAVHFLKGQAHPFSAFLGTNEEVLKTLAQTPDNEWKRADQREKLLHYFEADAFAADVNANHDAILKLPTGDFAAVRGQYGGYLLQNAEYLAGFKRTANQPEAYGTAPWRIAQLYDDAVAALKVKDLPKALLCLGTLGHYVGDMAQPLHTTMHYDGEYHPLAGRGVHDAIEDESFESTIALDTVTRKANHLNGSRGVDGLSRARLVNEVFKLIAGGWEKTETLIGVYAEHSTRAQSDRGRALASDSAAATRLREIVEDRMANATVLLARLWAAAFVEAGSPALGPQPVSLKDINPAGNYLPPTFLPFR